MSQFHESLPSTGGKSQSFTPESARRTSHPQADHNIALVLGGGGAAGNAWIIGIIAGLAEAGLDMTEAADLVIGTSSGATAAAQVRSGIPPAELFASVLSPTVRAVGQNRDQPPSLPMATVFERMRAIGAAATSAADLQLAMGAFGLESDAVLGPGAGQRRAMVAARLPRLEWPDRPMIVVAVDAHTGELAVLDRDAGVELVDAVTASTALPGSAPTVSANGTHYISGGVRSTNNADLASGYANVVVLSPLGGRGESLPEGQFEGLRREPEWGTDLASQVEALRSQGSHVEMITPDAGFPRRHGHEPDGSGHPRSLRPRRFRPRQDGSGPPDFPLTIARRGPARHRCRRRAELPLSPAWRDPDHCVVETSSPAAGGPRRASSGQPAAPFTIRTEILCARSFFANMQPDGCRSDIRRWRRPHLSRPC